MAMRMDLTSQWSLQDYTAKGIVVQVPENREN